MALTQHASNNTLANTSRRRGWWHTLFAREPRPTNNRRTELRFSQLEAREVPATGPNLLLNPGVETAATASRPANWQTGKWGTNSATFSYTNTGAIEGTRSVSINMSSRSSGDAKWYSDDVPVTAGATYVFSNQSVASVPTNLTLRFLLSNGSYLYQGNQVVPASATAQTNNFTFTAPANATSVTVFHIIQSVGTLTTDNFSLRLQTPDADVTPPTVSVTGPTNNASVSGVITLGANATDNLGVAGVQFRVDGNLFGTEDTTAPYNGTLNTATLPNGTHTITATARDTSGNVTTSAPITITVANAVADTTLPSVAILGPSNNATLSGTATLTASASDNIGVTSVRFLVDGNPVGTPITTTPYSFALNTTTLTNGTHTITAIATDAAGNTKTSDPVTVTVSNTTADTTAPSVSVTTPAANATLSGNATLSATATDNVGVAFVRYFVDGNLVSTNITTAPYNFTLNTTTLSNGTHTITAVATDAAGNAGASTAVTVTVNNGTSNNLIPNPSVETANGAVPASWSNNAWGGTVATFSYLNTGAADGNRAVRTAITTAGGGDAKWFFNAVPVTAGQTYTFSNSYRSSVASSLVIEYTTAGGPQYVFVGSVGTSATWANQTKSITVPAGATAMTMYHLISTVGFLEVDNYSLTQTSAPPASGALVSFTFDDGWHSQYTNALPILTAGQIPSTFYVMSEATQDAQQNELVRNPSLETDGSGGNPANWNRRTTGTNTTNFSVVTGKVGSKAAKVEVTSYTNGDAAWQYQNVNVIPGRTYMLSHQYSSSAQSTLAVQYTNSNNTTTLVDLRTLTSTNGNWNTTLDRITVPSGVTSLTVVQLLRGIGSVTVDDYSLRIVPTDTDYSNFSPAQVRALEALGHEIGGHTSTHADLATLSPAQLQSEVSDSRIALLNLGISQINTLAYPYGSYNSTVRSAVANSGYIGARTVNDGFNTGTTDRYQLTTVAVERDTTVQSIKDAIDEAIAQGSWVTLMFHRIDNDPTDIYGCTAQTLQQIVDYVNSRPIDVVTVRDGLYRTGLA